MQFFLNPPTQLFLSVGLIDSVKFAFYRIFDRFWPQNDANKNISGFGNWRVKVNFHYIWPLTRKLVVLLKNCLPNNGSFLKLKLSNDFIPFNFRGTRNFAVRIKLPPTKTFTISLMISADVPEFLAYHEERLFIVYYSHIVMDICRYPHITSNI